MGLWVVPDVMSRSVGYVFLHSEIRPLPLSKQAERGRQPRRPRLIWADLRSNAIAAAVAANGAAISNVVGNAAPDESAASGGIQLGIGQRTIVIRLLNFIHVDHPFHVTSPVLSLRHHCPGDGDNDRFAAATLFPWEQAKHQNMPLRPGPP